MDAQEIYITKLNDLLKARKAVEGAIIHVNNLFCPIYTVEFNHEYDGFLTSCKEVVSQITDDINFTIEKERTRFKADLFNQERTNGK